MQKNERDADALIEKYEFLQKIDPQIDLEF